MIEEVERLSTAYVQMLNNRNNADLAFHTENNGNSIKNGKSMNRTGSLLRNNTINANATAKARKQAAKEIKEAKSDPIASKTSKEDIILRILIARGKKKLCLSKIKSKEQNWLIVWQRKEWLEQQQKEDSIELVCIFVYLL